MADKTAEQQSTQLAHDASVAASQLSALVDEELENRENDLVLRRLGRDDGARARWERYHLIRDAIQGHLPDAFDTDFAARIRQAVEAEPLPQAAKALPAWYKPVTGFGLAASVVLVALFGFRLTQTDTILPAATQLVTVAPAISAKPAVAQVAAIQRPTNARKPVEARLNDYLVNHNGYASLNSVHGMLPYVRMVGYQTNR